MFIPRFKIVDSSFTLGPRKISSIVWFLLLLSIIFIIIGAALGGCKPYCTSSQVVAAAAQAVEGSIDSFYESILGSGGSNEEDSIINDLSASLPSNCTETSGSCPWLVIGCLMLVIPVPILLLSPWFFKM